VVTPAGTKEDLLILVELPTRDKIGRLRLSCFIYRKLSHCLPLNLISFSHPLSHNFLPSVSFLRRSAPGVGEPPPPVVLASRSAVAGCRQAPVGTRVGAGEALPTREARLQRGLMRAAEPHRAARRRLPWAGPSCRRQQGPAREGAWRAATTGRSKHRGRGLLPPWAGEGKTGDELVLCW